MCSSAASKRFVTFNPGQPLHSLSGLCTLPYFGNYSNTPSADQSTSLSALTNNDLQIGVGTVDNTGSNVNFAAANMKHVNGLAVVNLNAKTVPQTYYYDGNTGKASSVRAASTTTATVWPSVNFSSSTKPYSTSNTSSLKRYLAIVKPNTATTISTTATSGCEAWSLSYNVSKNTSSSQSVTSSRPGYYLGWVYSYKGAVETFTAPENANYKLECWGASGSDDPYGKGAVPGKGGYVAGCITFSSNTSLYIYVGGKGTSLYNHDAMTNAGGWNGGGFATANNPHDVGGGGGGSTDIRIIKHSDSNGWSGTASLRSRIIVAGGGGGCECPYDTKENGGNAGGLVGDATPYSSDFPEDTNTGTGGSQTSGGTPAYHVTNELYDFIDEISRGVVDPYGHFGYASQVKPTEYSWWSGGCGSGWYGGSNGHGHGGSGGSSFISGMTGCVAITADGKQTSGVSTMTINGKTYSFTSPVMKGGGESMPKHDGTSGTMTGNYGNGYAIITQLSY